MESTLPAIAFAALMIAQLGAVIAYRPTFMALFPATHFHGVAPSVANLLVQPKEETGHDHR